MSEEDAHWIIYQNPDKPNRVWLCIETSRKDALLELSQEEALRLGEHLIEISYRGDIGPPLYTISREDVDGIPQTIERIRKRKTKLLEGI